MHRKFCLFRSLGARIVSSGSVLPALLLLLVVAFPITALASTTTYLTAGAVTVSTGASFAASATLSNGISSAPISGRMVLFTFQASTQSAVTDSSGVASVNYTAPSSSGVYNYTASFAGDGGYSASSDVDNAVTVTATAGADVTPPVSRVTAPAGEVSAFTSIAGTAYDAVGVTQVRVSLKRWSDSNYWGGSTWISSETWNLASGTANWTYTGISSASLTAGTTYLAMSKAYDLASNTSNPFNSSSTFTYTSAAGPFSTYLNAAPVVVNVNAGFSAIATLTQSISSSPISGKMILFNFQASTQTAMTNSSGIASVTYTAPASTGAYSYEASFAGDGTYLYSGLTNAVTVTAAADVTPPLSRVTAPAGEVSAFTSIAGTAYDAGGLAQVQVSLKRWSDSNYWGGSTWISSETWNLASGTSNWTYTGISSAALTAGTTYLAMSKAYDLASNTSNPYNSSSTFTYVAAAVVPTTTYLTAVPVAASVNASFTASATLINGISSAPISGKAVLFAFQASTQSAVTNSSGIASVTYTAPASVSTYNYTANFAGDSGYTASSDSTNTVTVGLRPTALAAQNAATQASADFTATATLTDNLTAGLVVGKSVMFMFQGSARSAITDESGIATTIYTAPGSSGTYNYTASFEGDSTYAASSDSTNTVTVGLRPTVMVAQNVATQASADFTATATLTDNVTASPISGMNVLFAFQGSTQTAVTNSSGMASVAYTAPGTTGSYNYTASFAGDSIYAATSDSTNTVTVGLRPTVTAGQAVTIQASSTFTATATLTDNLTASPVSGKSVLFAFQGTTQTATTDGSGVAVVTYTAPGVSGAYNYTASFGGDSVYAASSDSSNTVTVGLRPSALATQNVTTQASTVFAAVATLTDSATTGPVSGKSVSFLFEGSSQSAVTNSSGIATVSY
ncbi:MAG: hypothetical protein Q7R35_12035, partial [Elusimicrobiota bacterium]|nr:hypothetical protein [Elusimicrobiota bacterium]